jgi:hypothetical protein
MLRTMSMQRGLSLSEYWYVIVLCSLGRSEQGHWRNTFAYAEPHILHVHAQDIVAKLKAELAACRNDSAASSSDGTPSRLSSGKTVRVGDGKGTPGSKGKFDPVAYTAKMQEKKEAAKHAKLERRCMPLGSSQVHFHMLHAKVVVDRLFLQRDVIITQCPWDRTMARDRDPGTMLLPPYSPPVSHGFLPAVFPDLKRR